MPSPAAKFINLCPVFLSKDVRKTVQFYVEKLGFKSAQHYDKITSFATLYRDEIEFVIVQASKGEVQNNTQRYGAGYDAYIDTAEVTGVDELHAEYAAKGVKIIAPPFNTDYGSREFVFEDIDGRHIGVGLIANNALYFKNSDFSAEEAA